MDFIETVEEELGQKAIKIFLPMQPGDLKDAFADNKLLEKLDRL